MRASNRNINDESYYVLGSKAKLMKIVVKEIKEVHAIPCRDICYYAILVFTLRFS
jgi:hypothetical protein